ACRWLCRARPATSWPRRARCSRGAIGPAREYPPWRSRPARCDTSLALWQIQVAPDVSECLGEGLGPAGPHVLQTLTDALQVAGFLGFFLPAEQADGGGDRLVHRGEPAAAHRRPNELLEIWGQLGVHGRSLLRWTAYHEPLALPSLGRSHACSRPPGPEGTDTLSFTNPLMLSGLREGEAPSEPRGKARTEPRPPGDLGQPHRARVSVHERVIGERGIIEDHGLGLAAQQADLQLIPELGRVRARLTLAQPIEPSAGLIAMPQ